MERNRSHGSSNSLHNKGSSGNLNSKGSKHSSGNLISKTMSKTKKIISENSQKVKQKWRKAVTGDELKRVRDELETLKDEIFEIMIEKQNQPVYIKLFDKIAFTLGVLNVSICQYFLLSQPQFYWIWFSIVVPVLLITRFFHFNSLGFQYFLLDFCYFVNGLCFLQLFFLNYSVTLFKVCFIYTTGPLTLAIVVWRNSFVFHDYDKITSVYIHILPNMLYYCSRWYKHNSILNYFFTGMGLGECHLMDNISNSLCDNMDTITTKDYVIAIGGYIFWQILYYVKTEVLDKDKLDQTPNLLTSLRWLSSSSKNMLSQFVLKVCRKLKLFEPHEQYDSNTIKTKVVFMLSQFIYTVLTFAPVPFIYNNQRLHLIYIAVVFILSVFFGASFYIEVFSTRYHKELEEKIIKRNCIKTSLSNSNIIFTDPDTSAPLKEEEEEDKNE
jgi:hypothetical protein